MAKSTTTYVCDNCGESTVTWAGRCEHCQEWNTLKAFRQPTTSSPRAGRAANLPPGQAESAPVTLAEISEQTNQRRQTNLAEFDRALGGGLVPGSVILLGGEPGIGKSTLLLQLASSQASALYVSGEESAEQIKLRASRLGQIRNDLKLMIATDTAQIADWLVKERPDLAIIDSIQTLYHPDFPSTPGSLVQVRESALCLQQLAKRLGITLILIGHVTKEGTVAGPRTLEHLVDVVLYLEGERQQPHRVLRSVKNRFGATNEIGIFEMTEGGMVDLTNPSKYFLAERQANSPGSVIAAALEGARPLLVEIQALTIKTNFGYPKRAASGLDLNRLNVLVAVLEKRAGLRLSDNDIYLNLIGGLRLNEPALDLPMAVAIVSAKLGKPVPADLALFGEIGLSGELRSVSGLVARQTEAERMGLQVLKPAKQLRQALVQIFGSGLSQDNDE